MKLFKLIPIILLFLFTFAQIAIAGLGASLSLISVQFSVDVKPPTVGLPGSAVFLAPVGNVGADIYGSVLPSPPSFTNGLIMPEVFFGLNTADDIDAIDYPNTFPGEPIIYVNSTTMMDMMITHGDFGFMFIQFSVDTQFVQGLAPAPTNAVFGESGVPEHPGDVYESQCTTAPAIGTNWLISDEDAQGLTFAAIPFDHDDLDALEIDESTTAIPPIFSLDIPNSLFISGADLFFAGPVPFRFASDLGLMTSDNIDALWIDGTFGTTSVHIFFSLAPGSPSLATITNPFIAPFPGVGCSAADILVCIPGPLASGVPFVAPFVVCPANSIGLKDTLYGNVSNDNLDALDVTEYAHIPIIHVPVELSEFYME